MKCLFVFLSLLLSFLSASIPFSSKVIHLTDDNFEHQTQASTGATTGRWVVFFHAPWCRTCSQLAPYFSEAADEFSGVLAFAEIEATPNTKIFHRFKIQQYPTVLFFVNGKIYEFEGELTNKEALITWITQGFEQSPSYDVPPPPTFFSMFLESLVSLYQEIVGLLQVKTLPGVLLLLIGFLCGLVSSLLIHFLISGRTSRVVIDTNVKSNKKKQN